MKKLKVKKNKTIQIVKDGKVIFDKKADKNLLIETYAEVIST